MPVMRRNQRGPSNAMFNHRMGGRVTLFNFNPSIAGGKIGVKRFHHAHHMGRIIRGNGQKAMTNIQGAEGTGLMNPGMSATHRAGMMGVAPPTSMHADKEGRKRVFESIAKHLSGGGKRSKC